MGSRTKKIMNLCLTSEGVAPLESISEVSSPARSVNKDILTMLQNIDTSEGLAPLEPISEVSSPARSVNEDILTMLQDIDTSPNITNLSCEPNELNEFEISNTNLITVHNTLATQIPENIEPITVLKTIVEDNSSEASEDLDFSAGSSEEFIPEEETNDEESDEDLPRETNEDCSTSSGVDHETKKKRGRKKSNENTRKRKRNPNQWERNKKKTLKEKGKQYTSSTGKNVPAKILGKPCACRSKCYEKFSLEERKIVFQNYYQLSSEAQNQYLGGAVEETIKSVERLRKEKFKQSRRKFSRNYFLHKGDERIKICQTMFLNTLCITLKKVRVIVEKKRRSTTGMCQEDKRGKHGKQYKIPEVDKDNIRNHIKLFPAYKSHYAREHSEKKYLPSNLSISHMYRLYSEYCQENNLTIRKESLYRKIFVEEFNLAFHKPQLDTCGKCDKFDLQLKYADKSEEKQAIEKERNIHLELAKTSYDEKKLDKNRSKENMEIVTASFDLQKCLPTPYLTSGIAFYKRQLWTLNLTIYETRGNVPASCYAYLWDETIAARGGQEIAACLFSYLKSLPEDVKEVNFYSDSCGGQNRNIFVCIMFLYAVQYFKQCGRSILINHKFLEAGHTHMEADTIHAAIEKTKKNTTAKIDLPRDWANLIRLVQRKPPIKVLEMVQTDFLNFKSLLDSSYVHRKKNTAGKPVSWLRLKYMQYRPENPGLVFYKESFLNDEEFKILDLSRRNSSRQVYSIITLKPSNSKPLKLSQEKLNDLQSLLPYISQNSRPYYEKFLENLSSSSEIEDFMPNERDEDEYE